MTIPIESIAGIDAEFTQNLSWKDRIGWTTKDKIRHITEWQHHGFFP